MHNLVVFITTYLVTWFKGQTPYAVTCPCKLWFSLPFSPISGTVDGHFCVGAPVSAGDAVSGAPPSSFRVVRGIFGPYRHILAHSYSPLVPGVFGVSAGVVEASVKSSPVRFFVGPEGFHVAHSGSTRVLADEGSRLIGLLRH